MNIGVLNICKLVAAMLLLLPGVTPALEVDVYGGFGAGYAVQKQDAPTDDTSDTGGKAYIGTRFLGPLGIEVAYYNLGKHNSAAVEVTAVGVDAVANLDIRGMTLFAKGGVMEWTETDLASGAELSDKDVTYGIGINLPVAKHVLLRTELEHFSKVGKDDATADPGRDMTMLSFGVNFKF